MKTTKEKIELARTLDERTSIALNIHDEWRIVHQDKLGIAYVSTSGVPTNTVVTVPLDLGVSPLVVGFFSPDAAREWCAGCGLEVR